MGTVESCCQGNKDDKMLVTKMDLSHCGCLEVPNVVFNAERCIETLILSSNQISALPPQLFHCQELKHLNLIDNCLTCIPPAIGSLLHLVSLKIDKNNLKDLPENLKMCRKLKRLSLNNNQWKQVPNIVTQLINLEELYMNDCELTFLPASVGRLTKLKIIELRNNNLCNLPLSMSRMWMLSRLDIGDNEFSEYPACINNLKNLKELLLDNNDIEEIGDVSNLVLLEHLDASYNHISNMSNSVGCCINLSLLNLSFNYIEQLPDSVGKIEELQTLLLEMNELAEIPKSIGQLSKLEELNLSNNRLYNIPNTIGLLRKLRTLNVSRNHIEEFPTEIGSCTNLSIVNASYNRLQALPSEIGYLSNLKVLDLVGNFLMYLPITIINLTRVRAIWLSANQNVPLIPFTEDLNIASGERFLTNIALPQLGEIPLYNQQGNDKNVESNDKVASWTRKIRFAEDEDVLPGKLHRTPTPFPKELRAPNRKHHARTDEPRPNYVNVVDGKVTEAETVVQSTSLSLPTKEGAAGLLNITESSVTMIREANIRRNKEIIAGMELDSRPNSRNAFNMELANFNETDAMNRFHPKEKAYVDGKRECNDVNIQTETHAENESNGQALRDDMINTYGKFQPTGKTRNFNENQNNVGNRNQEETMNFYREENRQESSVQELELSDETMTECDPVFEMANRGASHSFADGIDPQNFKTGNEIIYSNLLIHNSTEAGGDADYCRMDAQTIRGMYHNDVICGSNEEDKAINPPPPPSSPARNGIYETKADRPKYLGLRNVATHSLGNPTPPPPPPENVNYVPYVPSNEQPASKQDFVSLAEKMKSQFISPPCYEIAKLYSTKAALFEQRHHANN